MPNGMPPSVIRLPELPDLPAALVLIRNGNFASLIPRVLDTSMIDVEIGDPGLKSSSTDTPVAGAVADMLTFTGLSGLGSGGTSTRAASTQSVAASTRQLGRCALAT